MEKEQKKFLAIVLFVAITVRLLAFIAAVVPGHSAYSPALLLPDSYKYLDAASQIWHQGEFTRNNLPEIFLTPGYPLLLAVGFILGDVLTSTLIAQFIMSVLTVYLVFCIAGLLFPSNKKIAFNGALLYALEPLSVLYTWQLIPETLFTFLIYAAMYFFLSYVNTLSTKKLVFSAVIISASVYVKVVSFYLAPFLACGFVGWLLWKKRMNVGILKQLAIFLLVVAVLIGVWQIRNLRKTGFSGFSAITAYNMYYFEGASLLAKQKNMPVYEVQNRLAESPPELSGQASYYKKLYQLGTHVMVQHPFEYVAIYARGFCVTLMEPGAVDFCKFLGRYPSEGGLLGVMFDKGIIVGAGNLWKNFPAVFLLGIIFGGLLASYLFFALRAFTRVPWGRKEVLFAFLLCVIYFFLGMRGGMAGYSKYRHTFMPALCILAGIGFAFVTVSRSILNETLTKK